ncbi:hypothetical protein FOZ61_002455 [Perkinsus olseni]|uniref:Uncharacterized protein n=1 Tax=Perkinsus olseni TaxID=32597 RepID=A0A7J6KU97_PEROL|nr:hypothetical protein FOL46_000666 [Perkinsus olseni]KAF4662429.1 hypothetical protein FOZ61_002455 [Perkinsus olseni]
MVFSRLHLFIPFIFYIHGASGSLKGEGYDNDGLSQEGTLPKEGWSIWKRVSSYFGRRPKRPQHLRSEEEPSSFFRHGSTRSLPPSLGGAAASPKVSDSEGRSSPIPIKGKSARSGSNRSLPPSESSLRLSSIFEKTESVPSDTGGDDQVDGSFSRRWGSERNRIFSSFSLKKKDKIELPLSETPAEVYCHYDFSEGVLCLAKLPGSDFTDIFHHRLRSRETRSCRIITYPSHRPKGERHKGGPEEVEKTWATAVKQLNETQSWEGSEVRNVGNISFDVTALYVKPLRGNRLGIAFFTKPEKPSQVVGFTRALPGRHASADKYYVNTEPAFTVRAGARGNVQVRASVVVDGKRVADNIFPTDDVYYFKDDGSSDEETSKDQLFFFTFEESSNTFAVMKYGEKWAIMMSEMITVL